ncbi:transposase [Chryseobacterium sp. Mn2064]|uniref:transposase n=1 Tax=Chryseobacterium sp. Mn2064 TaxID=3395263 RepID=UPI003BBC5D31
MIDIKNIHIGFAIHHRVLELEIKSSRICNFLNSTEKEVEEMYRSETLQAHIILRWSKLLEYDFFRLYSQHLILYSPPTKANGSKKTTENVESVMPNYRKNLYTQEVIFFVLEQLETKNKTKSQIISEYGIPKTTLYKWIQKYKK